MIDDNEYNEFPNEIDSLKGGRGGGIVGILSTIGFSMVAYLLKNN